MELQTRLNSNLSEPNRNNILQCQFQAEMKSNLIQTSLNSNCVILPDNQRLGAVHQDLAVGDPLRMSAKSVNQPTSRPIVIGNLAGAGLLTSLNKLEQGKSLGLSQESSLINRPIINFIPVILQKPTPLAPKEFSNTAEQTNIFVQKVEKHPGNTFPGEKSDSEHINIFKPSLSSSDTLIINSPAESNSGPANMPTYSSAYSYPNSLVINSKSAVNESSFSLIRDLSDKSISLESIPTVTLFKSDGIELQEVSNDVIGQQVVELESANSPTLHRITIVGNNQIPTSILQLIKQEKENSNSYSSSNSDVQGSSKGRKLPEETSQQVDNSDTETDNDDTVFESCPQSKTKLQKADTLILRTEESNTVSKSSSLTTAATIILPTEPELRHSNTEDKISEGFSFSSLSIGSAISMDTALESLPLTFDNNTSKSSRDSKLTIGVSEPMNRSLYLMTGDGQLTAVRLITSDLCDISLLNQIGLMSNCFVNSPSHYPDSGSPAEGNVKIVEVKETQTELAFGANNILFKSLDQGFSNDSLYNIEAVSSSKLPDQMDNSSSSLTMISESYIPKSNTHPTIDILQEAVIPQCISITGSLQPHSQDLKYGSMPSHTPEPHLPDPSSFNISADSRKFKCMQCEEIFSNKGELDKHGKSHVQFFKCDLCNAKFNRLGNFTRHRKIHNLQPGNPNLFKCNDCGREFLQRCDLKRHLLIHTKQEPYRCEKCGKGYIRHSDLVVHLRFHNKDKAFKCTMCDKKFFQSGDLGRHVRKAHKPNSQLTCGHCERKYACETTLLRHMKAKHKDIIMQTINQRLKETDCTREEQ
ncbi:zinc finger protein 236-like isoform X2 [Physella acuta]|uniref:zinc finger protein 236-like isoform X2 n=1 Tax=Physella acuta TaxID=109671 RepID=UPI0027DDD9F2|nr:zinc finger protein 236-like isoform X2 [Physella acuta]